MCKLCLNLKKLLAKINTSQVKFSLVFNLIKKKEVKEKRKRKGPDQEKKRASKSQQSSVCEKIPNLIKVIFLVFVCKANLLNRKDLRKGGEQKSNMLKGSKKGGGVFAIVRGTKEMLAAASSLLPTNIITITEATATTNFPENILARLTAENHMQAYFQAFLT
ncbi:hypothetical protein FF38_00985 [Lucilia cuprina]|uniref:Uncharacterized protein n=1 Tax=Lucilia cuprina TaxID=7375 RepID=A0A0L0BLT9_LUCCU|nr:hypothetical protein FF38_00985 [Lucilia cuprina]